MPGLFAVPSAASRIEPSGKKPARGLDPRVETGFPSGRALTQASASKIPPISHKLSFI
jgi:hypothetical protein